MSAETRSLLPDWHQRPVRWKAESDLRITDFARSSSKTEWERLNTNELALVPEPYRTWRDWERAHRRSNCLIRYGTETSIPLLDWESVEVPWGRTDKWTIKR